MYKQVNGRKVQLTEEEESAMRAEWATAELEQQQQEQERQARQALMDAACNKVAQSCGLTEEEKQIYFRRTF